MNPTRIRDDSHGSAAKVHPSTWCITLIAFALTCPASYLAIVEDIAYALQSGDSERASTGQSYPDSLESEKEQSSRFLDIAIVVVEMLARGDEQGFMKLCSKRYIQANGIKKARSYISNVLVPFFSDYTKINNHVEVVPAIDAFGNRGYNFYWVAETLTGDQIHFIIPVLDDGGELVIGKVVLNKTYEEDEN